MSEWEVVVPPVAVDAAERLFFDDHEWRTIEAATARIIPTDHEPGAREAGAVRFIDRYLSGLDYVFAAADGDGFLRIDGRHADAWRGRIAELRRTYREGIRTLDATARERHGATFVELSPADQDGVLEAVSGRPKPEPVELGVNEVRGALQMGAWDDGLDFFSALVAHTRQGFYGDPVYGGNRDRVGWKVIGFPGPQSLRDTMDGTFSLREYFAEDCDWQTLIPHLGEGAQ